MEYYHMISIEHQNKLKKIAENKGIDQDTAMRNIIDFVSGKNILYAQLPQYFNEIFTIHEIETMIDMIYRSEKYS